MPAVAFVNNHFAGYLRRSRAQRAEPVYEPACLAYLSSPPFSISASSLSMASSSAFSRTSM